MSNGEDEIEQAVQLRKQRQLEHLIIRRYWSNQAGENIGYGTPQGAIILIILVVLLFFIIFVTMLLTHGITTIVTFLFLAELVLIGILTAFYSPQTGYYALDAQGKPVRFLQKRLDIKTPAMSREQYLQSVQQQPEMP